MNGLADPFHQLIERKLWPVAVGLLLALIAVPFLLKSNPESAPLPPTATTTTAATTDPLVTLTDAGRQERLRTVLGDRKEPFRPAQIHRVKEEKPATDTSTPSAGPSAGGSSAGGDTGGTGGAGGTGGSPTTPGGTTAPAVTPTPTPSFALYSLTVRFGPTDGKLVTRNVKRLTGLPGGPQPAALYLGLLDNKKSAVFIIDAGVKVLGDGDCDPSPEDCQTLTLKKGETEFLSRGDKEWELDLIDIHVKKTGDERTARTARTAEAPNGRDNLRRLLPRIGPYRYDEGAGTLEKLPKAELAKRIAKAARSAGSG